MSTVITADTNFDSGAVRSGDRNHLDFTVLPLIGLIGVAKVAGSEGNVKYGRHNYMLGMPVHDLLNHAIGHIVMYLLGDRSEPHLEKAAWGMMVASQSAVLDPELSEAHLLGPGATVTPAMLAFIQANAPALTEARQAGKFEGIGKWDMRDIPEINQLLSQREAVRKTREHIEATNEEPDGGPDKEVKVRKKRRSKSQIEADKIAAVLAERVTPVESQDEFAEPEPDPEPEPEPEPVVVSDDSDIAAMDAI